MMQYALSTIGASVVLYMVYQVARFIWVNYYYTVDVKKKYAAAGSWAVVTGASDGIGRSLTIELARRGMNVVLISRTKSKLEEVEKVIQQKYRSVQTKTISFDFADATGEQYAALFKQLDSVPIGILVNNVGMSHKYVMPFTEAPIDVDMRVIKVNCESQVYMSKYVIPRMVEKRCGAIINLSSVSAQLTGAYLATYGATKAFNLSFSDSLAVELKEFGIDVMAVTPNTVVTTMTQGVSTKIPRESFMMVNSDVMARQTIGQLGATRCTGGHLNHCIVEAALYFLPAWICERMVVLRTQSMYNDFLHMM